MADTIDVAIVGATGAVGETMIDILAERDFPVGELHLLASERSAGKRIAFRGKQIAVKNLETFDFSEVQLGLFSAGGSISAEHAPRAAAARCAVVDNTSHFRRDSDIPLVVPEVNPDAVDGLWTRGIIANPNCSTIQMLVALKPLHDAARLKRINVSTYQAVSGTGKSAIEELAGQTARLLNGQPVETSVYPKQIAFNALPHIDTFQDNGYTREEMKMVWETQKIFGDETIAVNPTCVRVPVFHGHAEAVHIETEHKLSATEARALLENAAGVSVLDEQEDGGYATQVTDAAGADDVFVSRIREDISHEHGLNLWVVSDNLRKGAALNSIQIAELLIARGLLD
ncbi:MAG: aspartate-semialdehyde dehydrogenase [Pseudomonadota bacterium]